MGFGRIALLQSLHLQASKDTTAPIAKAMVPCAFAEVPFTIQVPIQIHIFLIHRGAPYQEPFKSEVQSLHLHAHNNLFLCGEKKVWEPSAYNCLFLCHFFVQMMLMLLGTTATATRGAGRKWQGAMVALQLVPRRSSSRSNRSEKWFSLRLHLLTAMEFLYNSASQIRFMNVLDGGVSVVRRHRR